MRYTTENVFYRRTAENVAETYHISRKAHDAFALESQRRPKTGD
ncbi:thiolase family protein [Peribacillus butanolivorans]